MGGEARFANLNVDPGALYMCGLSTSCCRSAQLLVGAWTIWLARHGQITMLAGKLSGAPSPRLAQLMGLAMGSWKPAGDEQLVDSGW